MGVYSIYLRDQVDTCCRVCLMSYWGFLIGSLSSEWRGSSCGVISDEFKHME